MRIIFLGSPAYVIPVLEKLLTLPGHQVVGVVSQPARPMGRSRSQLIDPPVAAFAKEQNLTVFQPEKINSSDMLQSLRDLQPDLAITAAYGQILSQNFLDLFKRGTINIHPSLLPAYRGATPIPSALLAGDKTTGVTILFTVKKLDAGNLIVQEAVDIEPIAQSSDLYDQLFRLGAELLPAALSKLSDPSYSGQAQDEAKVTHCGKIEKEHGRIQWQESADQIFNRFRAYNPWPGIHTFFDDKRVQIISCSLVDKKTKHADPGRFVFDKKLGLLLVHCATGSLAIQTVKPEGKKDIKAQDFWNGLGQKAESAVFL